MRQGRGVLAGFRVDSCAAAAAAATNTMLHRAASYMYTYLSLNQKKSDPRFIMPIIFLRTNLNLLLADFLGIQTWKDWQPSADCCGLKSSKEPIKYLLENNNWHDVDAIRIFFFKLDFSFT